MPPTTNAPKPQGSLNLQFALGLQEEGWLVFPLRAGTKRPLSAHGFHDGTDSTSQARRWWSEFPDAGVAVATGRKSGLVVVDVDPRNGGDETLRSLITQFGELPPTRCVATGGGGQHYYFRHPGGVIPGVQSLWPGIDLKSDGGYVVAPPSRHPSGMRYKFVPAVGPDGELLPVLPMPGWMHEEVVKAKKRELAKALKPATKDEKGEAILAYPEGSRNNALTSFAGVMQRRAMSYGAVLAALLAENEARCRPPLKEEDVVRIVDSVSRYEPEDPVKGAVTPKSLGMVDVQEWLTTEPPPIDWVLTGRLAKGDCALLVGPEACGKSWFSLDVGVAGGAGRPILGYKPFSGPRRRVLIVDEENPPELMWERLRHLAHAHEVEPEELDEQLYMLKQCQGFTFRDAGMVADLQRKVEVIQPDIIVIDSATAVSNVDNENDAVAIRRLFHDCLYPLREICGSTILLLHHANKLVWKKGDEAPRGSSAVRGSGDYSAAADAVLFLWPTDDKGVWRLATEKVRRGPTPPDLRYEIVSGYPRGARPLAKDLPAPKKRKRKV